MSSSEASDSSFGQPRGLTGSAQYWEHAYRSLLGSVPTAVFTEYADPALLAANPTGERLSGRSSGELAGLSFHRLFTAASQGSVNEMMRRAKSGAAWLTCDADLLPLGSAALRVRIHAAVLRDGDTPVAIRYLVEPLDIRQRPDAGTGAESMFRWMTKDLTEMVMAYDMQRRLIFANPATQSLTGYSLEELEKAHFICWVHQDDRARMLGYWDTLFAGRSFHDEEYRLVTKDGRAKWVVASWGPILDDRGRQVGVQGRERDITERKLAEETLRHSEQKLRIDEERYRSLFEDSPFPLWEEDFSEVKSYIDWLLASGVTDLRGHLTQHRELVMECLRRVRVLDVNRAAREFYRASSRQELLDNLIRIFDERALEVFRDEIVTLASGGSPFRAEFPARTLDGEPRLVTMNVSIIESRRNDWSTVIVSFFDITDRKQLEDQLLQSRKMESLGRLAGGIAHDFNNLLTVVNGYSDLLLGKMAPGDPAHRGLTLIRRAGQRCAELTGQLLTFSRKTVIQPKLLDLNALIQESHGVLGRLLGDDIRSVITLDPHLGMIEADQGQMHQVLMNLVVNAREAMPSGGTLTVTTRNVTLAPDHRREPGGKPFILLEVRDTGTGIDEQAREHLFEPFFTTKRGPRNSGLGLATAFAIVSQAGGSIEVGGAPGAGAVFSVYLPQVAAAVARPGPLAPPQTEFRGSGTALVVDDREYVRKLICTLMEDIGYRVLEAGSGAEALELASRQERPIDLLLTDIIMPEMNGRELAERLRQMGSGIKTILMSGFSDRFLDRSGPLDACAAYLQKPFTRAQLIDVLRQVMEPGRELDRPGSDTTIA